MIKAPFNFVPVSSEVYYPGWADQISHDIPFSDGISGKISITIEAKTPIFIRDSKSKTEFCHIMTPNCEKKYFIPGTSIKGMVRNVLEILSFGKLSMDEKMRFSTREWDKPYIYKLKDPREQDRVRCGWLQKVDGKIKITDCGKPKRINHIRIDEMLGSKLFENTFKRGSTVDLNVTQTINGQNYDPKTASYKYAILGNQVSALQNKIFIKDDEYQTERQTNRMKFSNVSEGELGTIVFTGQPDNWNMPRAQRSGKFYEFVFIDKTEPRKFLINSDNFEKFEYLHRKSDDWKYWRKKLSDVGSKGIPVFFRIENSEIKDFGLAFLYKVPFTYSPKEINNIHQKIDCNSGADLAQCIFGFSAKENDNQSALKGRIQFSPAKPINEPIPFTDRIRTTLGSPRASYYPIYIVQTPQTVNDNIVEKYITYNDRNAQLKWKRYPVHNSVTNYPSAGNDDINTEFLPLKSGIQFESYIRFHNLRSPELGALLSAISFHGNEKNLFHSIGMAKPMGFGKISINYSLEPEANANRDPDFYMAAFEREMNHFLGKDWIKTEQIKELFTMAWDKKELLKNVDLSYMVMSTSREDNQFARAKNFNKYLKLYTELTGTFFQPASISEKFDEINKNTFNSLYQKVLLLENNDDIETAAIQLKEALSIIPGHERGLETLKRLNIKIEFTKLKKEADGLIKSGDYKKAREKIELSKNYTDNPKLLDPLIARCIKSARERDDLESVLNKQGDFGTNINRINGYLKQRKIDKLNERDCAILFKMVEFWIAKNDRNYNVWTSDFETSKYWRKITVWTSMESAKDCYERLISGKQS